MTRTRFEPYQIRFDICAAKASAADFTRGAGPVDTARTDR